MSSVGQDSWFALEWGPGDSRGPLSTRRSEDYAEGFRRGREAEIRNACVLLQSASLNATLSCGGTLEL